MNALQSMVQLEITQAVETMTSLEIVDLINKGREVEANGSKWKELRHSDFMAKVPQVLGSGDERKFSSVYLGGNGQERKCYKFPERETMLMLMSYSYDLQAAVYDRMTELKNQLQAQLPDFTNPAEAAIAWAEQYKAKEVAEKALHVAKPKVDHYDNVVEREGLLNATQVGAKVGLSAMKLNKYLTEMGVYNKNVTRSKLFNLWFIDKEYGETKQTLDGYTQSLFTLRGEAWVFEQLVSEGII